MISCNGLPESAPEPAPAAMLTLAWPMYPQQIQVYRPVPVPAAAMLTLASRMVQYTVQKTSQLLSNLLTSRVTCMLTLPLYAQTQVLSVTCSHAVTLFLPFICVARMLPCSYSFYDHLCVTRMLPLARACWWTTYLKEKVTISSLSASYAEGFYLV